MAAVGLASAVWDNGGGDDRGEGNGGGATGAANVGGRG